MKRPTWLIISVALLFVLLGCSLSQIATSAPTATPTPQPTNTELPSPTATAVPPTPTPKPTTKPRPTDVPKVTVGQFAQALGDAGFTSNYFSDGSGTVWTLDNPFENIYTFKSGKVELDVLNSVKSRLDHMEIYLQVMDSLFPADFMAQLRDANNAFAKTVGAGVTGKASDSYGPIPGDFWKFVSSYYNVSDQTIQTYKVQFALFFEQWTCPSGYICTFPSFGNQQFEGQASFVFYEVMIWLNT
jgi:hypothetical protein